MTVAVSDSSELTPTGWTGDRDEDRFDELYRRWYPRLVEVCSRRLPGGGDAEAVAQDAFVRAWRSLDHFCDPRPFWPWLATIANHLCIDYRRRDARQALHLHVEAAVNERQALSPDEIIEAAEERRAVLYALARLKPAEQRVLALREFNGWSYDEIAQFEGVSVESIRSSLKRARAALRCSFVSRQPSPGESDGQPASQAGSW